MSVDQEEGRCQCFDGAVFMIEAFKAQQYEVVTPSGAVQRNCIEALKESSPKVVAQYQQCIAGLQGTGLSSSLCELKQSLLVQLARRMRTLPSASSTRATLPRAAWW